jgi:hypothetical protein
LYAHPAAVTYRTIACLSNTAVRLIFGFIILDFKLSLCSVLTVSIFGWFEPLKMDPIEGSETSANINQTLGIHPKIETVNGFIILS